MIEIGGMETIFASSLVDMVKSQAIQDSKKIVITFDDAWPGVADYATKLLMECGDKATYFVHISGINAGRPMRCNWEDLRNMKKSTHWEIGSHSLTHSDLTRLDENAIRKELLESLNELHSRNLNESNLFAYPYGAHNERVRRITKEVGYHAAFSAGTITHATNNSNLFSIPRTTVSQLYDQSVVCAKMGLDYKEMRKSFAIYDEIEGQFIGKWHKIDYKDKKDKETTYGQYGRSYCYTDDENAFWKILLNIEKEDSYTLSLWNPVKLNNKENIRYEVVSQLIDKYDNRILLKQICLINKQNGWNVINKIHLKKGTYEFEVHPLIDKKHVIVDALKVVKSGY